MDKIMNSFFSLDELASIGLKSFGDHVLVSRKASIYSPEKTVIGNHVRIDDFCILSGEVQIGSHIHISAYTALFGRNGIFIDDYAGLSPRCTVFSATDDFSGDSLIGPMVNQKHTNVIGGPVFIEKYVQVGAGCVVFPNLSIKEGAAIGAMSLVDKSIEKWVICAGVPAKFLKKRSMKLLNYFDANENIGSEK